MAVNGFTKRTNLISKYVSKDIGRIFEDTRLIAGSVAGGVLISQLVTRYSNNPSIGKWAGILTAGSGGMIPLLVTMVVYNPEIIARFRGK